MNTITAFTYAREKQIIAEKKRHIMPRLSVVEKIGAATMTFVGSTLDLLNSNKSLEDLLSPLRRHAYSPGHEASIARRTWAGFAAAAVLTVGGLSVVAVHAIDDELACNSKSTTLILEDGGNLSELAGAIPHENTPLSEVIEDIVDRNPNKIGEDFDSNHDPDIAQTGVYDVSVSCDSYL